MSISAKSDDSSMWVELSDGRTIGVPFAWFPRLVHVAPEQRERVEIGRMGLHSEELDEIAGRARRPDALGETREKTGVAVVHNTPWQPGMLKSILRQAGLKD